MTVLPTAPPHPAGPASTGWLSPQDCRLDDFRAVVETATDPADVPLADRVESGVPVYGERLRAHVRQGEGREGEGRREAQAELARALADGPGIVVLSGAFLDADGGTATVDRASAVFRRLIEEQKAAGVVGGDHFATPGANDRIWGALDKFAVADPEAFVDYYANDLLALVAEAWLGPNYQVTSQVNVVNPGGRAQTAHRDYHLGFTAQEEAARYPAHVHRLSPVLTLQGAVAHCDMPVETGPTLYLPHSQKYLPGYLAFHRPEFTGYFQENFVQLPLSVGDAVFFNPALFHGAGTNRSADVRRTANLLQVSSAFGRAMESVDRVAVSNAVYPVLRRRKASGADARFLADVVASAAEGYPFPTNLDDDQPVGGMAPPSQADLLHRALAQDWEPADLARALSDQQGRRRSTLG